MPMSAVDVDMSGERRRRRTSGLAVPTEALVSGHDSAATQRRL